MQDQTAWLLGAVPFELQRKRPNLTISPTSHCPTAWTALPPAPRSLSPGFTSISSISPPAAPVGRMAPTAGRGDVPPWSPFQKLIFPDLSNVLHASYFLLCKVSSNKSHVEITSPEQRYSWTTPFHGVVAEMI